MQSAGHPLAALPNIGLASLLGGQVIYPHATPEYFAEFAAHARDLGARVIGGCCGTTPTEIAAIRAAIDEGRQARSRLDGGERAIAVALGEEQRETELARALREGEFVVSVQLDPPLGGSSRGLLEVARELEGSGLVRFVDVNDNATARAGISSLIVSGAIERATGLETIPHLTTRDSTVLGLESLLLGMHSEGVRNVLAITGDPPEVGDYPGSRGVYEIDSVGLTRLIAGLNRGEDFNGRPIDAPTSFFVGVAVNPTADDLELEAERFRQKVEAGARFAMTQIVFDLDVLDRFAEVLGGWPVPVLAGIFPLTSYRLALRLHNEVPGIVVPQHLQDELDDAGPAAAEVGMSAREGAARRGPGALRGRLRRRAVPQADLGARAARQLTRQCRGDRADLLLDPEHVVRRRDPVEALEDPRLPHVAVDPRVPVELERHRTRDPDDREPPEHPHGEPAERVEQPQRRQQVQPAADELRQERGHEPERDHPHDRAAEPDQRGVLRVRPAVQEARRKPGPDDRPGDEPGQRQHGPDQSAPPAGERGQHHDDDDGPVELAHPAGFAVRLHCPPLGGVVQLVRTPACHAGGRGFESRRSRSHSACKTGCSVAAIGSIAAAERARLLPEPSRDASEDLLKCLRTAASCESERLQTATSPQETGHACGGWVAQASVGGVGVGRVDGQAVSAAPESARATFHASPASSSRAMPSPVAA